MMLRSRHRRTKSIAQLRTTIQDVLRLRDGVRPARPTARPAPCAWGSPAALPVINKAAVEMAVRAGLALNCTIGAHNRFARKNYFYPDLPKGLSDFQYEVADLRAWLD